MTDNDVAALREQLIIARADLRVKDEQLNSARALLSSTLSLLNSVEANLAIARGDISVKDEQLKRQSEQQQEQLRAKDEQLARKDEQVERQLRVKDEQHQEQLGRKDEQLRVKDEQLRAKDEQIERSDELLRLQYEERRRLYDRFDGHLANLLQAHQATMLNAHRVTREYITRQVNGLAAHITRQPNNALSHHGYAVLLTPVLDPEEEGVDSANSLVEHRVIRGQERHVNRVIANRRPESEVFRPFTTTGNGINLGVNLARVMRQKVNRAHGGSTLTICFLVAFLPEQQAQARGFRIKSTRSKISFSGSFTRQTLEDAYRAVEAEIRAGIENLLVERIEEFDSTTYNNAYSTVQADLVAARQLIPV